MNSHSDGKLDISTVKFVTSELWHTARTCSSTANCGSSGSCRSRSATAVISCTRSWGLKAASRASRPAGCFGAAGAKSPSACQQQQAETGRQTKGRWASRQQLRVKGTDLLTKQNLILPMTLHLHEPWCTDMIRQTTQDTKLQP